MSERESAFRLIRQSARDWWYHRELRATGRSREAMRREHQSVRDRLRMIRTVRASNGWLSIGRGGNCLYMSPDCTCSGMDEKTVRALILLGVPAIDTREADIHTLTDMVVDGPMMGFADRTFGDNPDGFLSTRHWPTMFRRYAERVPGCVFHNFDPESAPC